MYFLFIETAPQNCSRRVQNTWLRNSECSEGKQNLELGNRGLIRNLEGYTSLQQPTGVYSVDINVSVFVCCISNRMHRRLCQAIFVWTLGKPHVACFDQVFIHIHTLLWNTWSEFRWRDSVICPRNLKIRNLSDPNARALDQLVKKIVRLDLTPIYTNLSMISCYIFVRIYFTYICKLGHWWIFENASVQILA